jgi:hypothetical protein
VPEEQVTYETGSNKVRRNKHSCCLGSFLFRRVTLARHAQASRGLGTTLATKNLRDTASDSGDNDCLSPMINLLRHNDTRHPMFTRGPASVGPD